jgi:glutamate dehydrogenase
MNIDNSKTTDLDSNIINNIDTLTLSTDSHNDSRYREKVTELVAILKTRIKEDEIFSILGGSNKLEDYLMEFCIGLFRKMPNAIFKHREIDSLVEIAHFCLRALSDFLTSPDTPFIFKLAPTDINNRPERESYCKTVFVTFDRSFLVKTIVSVFERLNVDIKVLLHPILLQPHGATPNDGLKISLIYVEHGEENTALLEQLADSAKASMADVIACTQDYNSMQGHVKELIEWYDRSTFVNTPGEKSSQFCNVYHKELAAFLAWLTGNQLLYLGTTKYRVGTHGEILPNEGTTSFGIFRNEGSFETPLWRACHDELKLFCKTDSDFFSSRLKIWSKVQRHQRIINLMFRTEDEQGLLYHSIIGLFNIAASYQSSNTIPLIRTKLATLLSEEGVIAGSYDWKFINRAIDNMPKELALYLDAAALGKFINVSLGTYNQACSQIAIHFNRLRNRIDTLVVIPRASYSQNVEDAIIDQLENRLSCGPGDIAPGDMELTVDHSADNQVRVYTHLSNTKLPENIDTELVENIEIEIRNVTRNWDEKLQDIINKMVSYPLAYELLNKYHYGAAFPPDYKATFCPATCIKDIQALSSLTTESPIDLVADTTNIQNFDSSSSETIPIDIIIYSLSRQIPINIALPILEYFGFEVIGNDIYPIELNDGLSHNIHRYQANLSPQILKSPYITSTIRNGTFKNAVIAVLLNKMESDVLNQLVLGAGLPHQAIAVLRAYSGYLWQVIKYATRGSIYHTLANSPELSATLWSIFENRFSPHIDRQKAISNEEALVKGYYDLLRSVKSINQDRILRSLLNIILQTVRTNFYQGGNVLAFKINARSLDILPEPKPLFEIYIRSTEFEGVHLRNGRTARGGIRWSERIEDYRFEILGLVKTQTIKNVLIVPTGAKGGFALRHLPTDPVACRSKVEECYKHYIRALLSITDNIIDETIITPPNVLAHDEADPYLVVAADKGTATFSDLANKIASEEFSFWLGDAFASGGSNGYDHKKYGITAKGAFESVKRHFHDLGIEYINEPFTAIGIGDMSGDVFGNGLLLSKQYKLLAAFNHIHIFIDPDPDPLVSYEERKLLFEMPRSKWTDYNPNVISPGGGVYDRFAKEIAISNEARAALGLGDEAPSVLNGEELIRLILCAPATLLWNGGIGTYVKSSVETHADVNDSTNDQVRVNATQLRVRVVGEGGNLGFTQRARIEYSQKGGRIITDAVDNSGGVDLSDHEVNIKLCLKPLVSTGRLSEAKRNELLLEIVNDVVDSVLEHNQDHSSIISLGLSRSLKSIHYFQSLIRELEKMGYINRTLEALPSAEELNERVAHKDVLHMPELAVCMAAVKMWVKDQLLNSPLVKDPLLDTYLVNYFPTLIRENYREEICKHPLRSEIIATQITNTFIDAVGITFMHRMCSLHAVLPITVIKCTLCAELLLNTQALRRKIRSFDTTKHAHLYIIMHERINSSVRRATSWLIDLHGHGLSLDQMVITYASAFQSLLSDSEEIFGTPQEGSIARHGTDLAVEGNLNSTDLNNLILIDNIANALDIMSIIRQSGASANHSAVVYSSIIETLKINFLLGIEDHVETNNKWEHQVLMSASNNIRKNISRLAVEILQSDQLDYNDITTKVLSILKNSRSYPGHLITIDEIQNDKISVAALSILANQLQHFLL